MAIGIYMILHVPTGMMYIGQSQQTAGRWRTHKCSLRKRKHFNKRLQSLWNISNEEDFVFKVIEETTIEQLCDRERFHLDAAEPSLLVNVSMDTEVPIRGHKMSEGTRKKMSESQKRRYSTPEGRAARSAAAKAVFKDEAVRIAHSERQRAWASTDEARAKNRAAQLRSYQENPERREAARQRMLDRIRRRGQRPEQSCQT